MFSTDSFLGLSSLGSIVFSYADEYSDEKITNEMVASDFEDAETDDDFASFDDDADLYSDFDCEDDFSEEDAGHEHFDETGIEEDF
ncbi:hypothetical protein [Treponema sp.]|uniref:hypothetical protein n=1 Tax=Treponema sp. TaxID=166 RepID=UPI00298E4699|nr:hypothetical protein [Treponema sp.]MCR5613083.1 hypothetical protein [Treponema sp.]